jgi:hypothetical protein
VSHSVFSISSTKSPSASGPGRQQPAAALPVTYYPGLRPVKPRARFLPEGIAATEPRICSCIGVCVCASALSRNFRRRVTAFDSRSKAVDWLVGGRAAASHQHQHQHQHRQEEGRTRAGREGYSAAAWTGRAPAWPSHDYGTVEAAALDIISARAPRLHSRPGNCTRLVISSGNPVGSAAKRVLLRASAASSQADLHHPPTFRPCTRYPMGAVCTCTPKRNRKRPGHMQLGRLTACMASSTNTSPIRRHISSVSSPVLPPPLSPAHSGTPPRLNTSSVSATRGGWNERQNRQDTAAATRSTMCRWTTLRNPSRPGTQQQATPAPGLVQT